MLPRPQVTVLLSTVVFLIAVAACGDDDAGGGSSSGGASGAASATYCQALTDTDSFCTCKVATAAPPNEATTCDDKTTPYVACCKAAGACNCKVISCSEFSDGSCTCKPGDPSTDQFVEACNAPDEGHCCRSADSYCTCSASSCFDGDEEVDSCNPGDLADKACAAGESKVSDCKAGL